MPQGWEKEKGRMATEGESHPPEGEREGWSWNKGDHPPPDRERQKLYFICKPMVRRSGRPTTRADR